MTALIEASMEDDNKPRIDLSGKFHAVSKAQNPKTKLNRRVKTIKMKLKTYAFNFKYKILTNFVSIMNEIYYQILFINEKKN